MKTEKDNAQITLHFIKNKEFHSYAARQWVHVHLSTVMGSPESISVHGSYSSRKESVFESLALMHL